MLAEDIAAEKIKNDLNVLVLDDDDVDLEIVASTLKDIDDQDFNVVEFDSLESALKYLECSQSVIDICLVDYEIGEYTAFDFLREIDDREIPSIPVVVMTGQKKDTIDEKLLLAGVHDYWSKWYLNSETLSRCLRFAYYRHKNYQEVHLQCENKNRHMAYINHELKTPVNGIAGFSRILENHWRDGRINETDRINRCFEGIRENTELLTLLINRLLDYTEIESNQLILNKESVDFVKLIKNGIDQFKPLAEEDGLYIDLETFDEDKLIVEGDKVRLVQIINNLLSNAIKYTQKGGVMVELKYVEWQSKPWVQLTVSDTGIGIPENKLLDIFSEYTKVHTALAKQINSTGLGLPIVKKLVSMHKGEIAVRSEYGKGSSFVVFLPCSY